MVDRKVQESSPGDVTDSMDESIKKAFTFDGYIGSGNRDIDLIMSDWAEEAMAGDLEYNEQEMDWIE